MTIKALSFVVLSILTGLALAGMYIFPLTPIENLVGGFWLGIVYSVIINAISKDSKP